MKNQSSPPEIEELIKEIESSKNLIEEHQKNIKSYEHKVYELLIQKREEIKRQQKELVKELEKVENQLLIWDYISEF